MGFVSIEHAERQIERGLANGPMGDDDISFVNVLTRGMTVNDSVIDVVHKATENLERQGKIRVMRNSSGTPQIVELCADQIVDRPSPTLSVAKRSLGKLELLKEMHDLLKAMSNDKGLVYSHHDYGDFVKSLHRKLSEDFVVELADVITVFDAMTTLDLRGNARSLRGVGMWVLQRSLMELVSDDSELEDLRDYGERNRLNLEQTTEQLIAAQAEIRQLSADLDESRCRHARATEQIMSMRTELERVTMSRDQLRTNNAQLKAFPINLLRVVQEMVGSSTED